MPPIRQGARCAGDGPYSGKGLIISREWVEIRRIGVNATFMSPMSSTFGISQGSDALAMYPSANSITGVMYLVAMRVASIAVETTAGERAATTGNGLSAFRP